MQENEFEKQIQQKMDELKLHPSDTVWPKIEAQVRKEKRRRWVLIFLPLILISFLYGGYVWLSNNNSNNEYQHPTKNIAQKNNINQITKPGFDSIKNNEPVIEKKNRITEAPTAKSSTQQKIRTSGKLKMSSNYTIAERLQKDTSLIVKNVIDTTSDIVQNEKINNPEIQNFKQEKISGKEDQPESTLNQSNKIPEQVITDIKKEKEKE